MTEEKISLSKKEKIVLINQYRILSKLFPEESSHYSELISILQNGYSIFYSQLEQWIDDDMPMDKSKLVLNILDLYRIIEDTKRRTKDSTLIKHHYSYFQGFDGNNESECLSFSHFLIKKQGKFSEQQDYLIKNDNLNSHMEMSEKYKAMLGKWESIGRPYTLSVEQAIEILDARHNF
ncbi:YfbU family protein [Serratia marcescens]|uniref:YfbU family protein n=1 Tax=Serratia marcescens TaxID=615 RepID=UPI003988F481